MVVKHLEERVTRGRGGLSVCLGRSTQMEPGSQGASRGVLAVLVNCALVAAQLLRLQKHPREN